MLAVEMKNLPLKETWTEEAPAQRARSTFPLLGLTGNRDVSAVYFELEPGRELGSHTDSAEELLFIIEGRVSVTVGDEQETVEGPALAVVPTMLSHNLENIGRTPVRVLGFFPSRDLVATFEREWQPDGTHVIDTSAVEKMLANQPAG